jgi:hypothetical protein
LVGYLPSLHRCVRILKHLNDLTSSELSNQPEKALLHSNTLFFFIFDLLCRLLEIPNSDVIGIANINFIVSGFPFSLTILNDLYSFLSINSFV